MDLAGPPFGSGPALREPLPSSQPFWGIITGPGLVEEKYSSMYDSVKMKENDVKVSPSSQGPGI